MTLQNKLSQRDKTRIIEFEGIKIEVPRMTRREKKEWKEEFESLTDADERRGAQMFSDLLRDPVTKQPVLTIEFILDDLLDEDMLAIMQAIFVFDPKSLEKN